MSETLRSNKAEALRIKYEYRKLVMDGKVHIPMHLALRLIGPDCAYHLYSQKQKK